MGRYWQKDKMPCTAWPDLRQIEEALKSAEIGRGADIPVIRCDSMEEAVIKAYENAVPGDVVLLSPASASFDRYRNFEERGNHFKRIVGDL